MNARATIFCSRRLFEFARNINADVVLFQAGAITDLIVRGAVFRRKAIDDRIFKHTVEPVGDYVVELEGQVVATGGFLLHYNFPFADVYMEVEKDHRRKGVGSFLVQEIIKQCYLAGRAGRTLRFAKHRFESNLDQSGYEGMRIHAPRPGSKIAKKCHRQPTAL